jgi:uncharacterized phage infection (PIP) family protein YhgE
MWGDGMSKIKPAGWLASGVKDLPRNGAWLLSKALRSPIVATESAAQDTSDGLRRMTVAVADRLPGGPDTVGIKLKRAEAAVAKAKEAESRALAEAQVASERADNAKAVSEEGKQRIREATREGKQEVDRRTQEAREHYTRLINQERDKASQEVAERMEQLTTSLNAEAERARAEAEQAAEHARALIEDAHQQMAEARQLAAEATAAAQEAADLAREQARAVAEKAEERAGSADRIVDDAQRAEGALATVAARAAEAEDLRSQTKADLTELARSLGIQGASRMTKDQLIRTVRSASRARR